MLFDIRLSIYYNNFMIQKIEICKILGRIYEQSGVYSRIVG